MGLLDFGNTFIFNKKNRKKDVWLIACNACTLIRRKYKANVSMDMVLNRTQLITALRTKLLGKEMASITQTSHRGHRTAVTDRDSVSL